MPRMIGASGFALVLASLSALQPAEAAWFIADTELSGPAQQGPVSAGISDLLDPNPFFAGSSFLEAGANASAEGLRASGHAFAFVPALGLGSQSSAANASARFIFDDFIITGPGPGPVPASPNFTLNGTFTTSATLTGPIWGTVSSSVNVSLNGSVAGNAFGGNWSQFKSISENPFTGVSTDQGGNGIGILAGTGTLPVNPDVPVFMLPVGVHFTVDLILGVSAVISKDVVTTSATPASVLLDSLSDFSHTVTFALNGPAFDLPPGYTVNSNDANVVNNQFISAVPEPSMLVLLGSALLGLGARRRRSG